MYYIYHDHNLNILICYSVAHTPSLPGDGHGLYPAPPVDLWWPWVGVIHGPWLIRVVVCASAFHPMVFAGDSTK